MVFEPWCVMRTFKLIATVIAVQGVSSSALLSQSVIEPEACILDALKGGTAKEAMAMVRFNCVRQYIKSVQSIVVNASTEKFGGSTISHYAAIPAMPSEISERLSVSLKNESSLRIVMADIKLTNKKTRVEHTFRGLSDFPIEPRMVGKIDATINLGLANLDDWTWTFANVWGVPIR
jgi:hypothetical protein